MSTAQNAPAGWYPQPDGSQRYWDGYQWTEHFAPPPDASTEEALTEPWYTRKRIIIPAAALIFIVAIATLIWGNNFADVPEATATSSSESADTNDADPEPSADPTDGAAKAGDGDEQPEPAKSTEPTASQIQAILAAEFSLTFGTFSREGLIEDLTFENEHSQEDAEFAVDYMDIDWYEQALATAENYLKQGISEDTLIHQLEYGGFSADEVAYGVENITADWMEQAALSAEKYVAYEDQFSREDLISALKFEGFSAEEAAHGADSVGL